MTFLQYQYRGASEHLLLRVGAASVAIREGGRSPFFRVQLQKIGVEFSFFSALGQSLWMWPPPKPQQRMGLSAVKPSMASFLAFVALRRAILSFPCLYFNNYVKNASQRKENLGFVRPS
jgi:hypothetical protein